VRKLLGEEGYLIRRKKKETPNPKKLSGSKDSHLLRSQAGSDDSTANPPFREEKKNLSVSQRRDKVGGGHKLLEVRVNSSE